MIARWIALAVLLSPSLASGMVAPEVHPYLEVNGKEVNPAAVQISRTASEITAVFQAPRAGIYSFGISISATELTPLVPGMRQHNCSSVTQPVVLRYPYDWTAHDFKSNILSSRPRLVMPGLNVDGQTYLANTHELFSLRLEPCKAGQIRALLLAHRFFNDGGDRATPELNLRAGETRKFVVQIYKDIKAANRDRFGEHDPTMRGNMVGIFFLEQAEDTGRENDGFYSASGSTHCCRSFTPEEWELTARKLQGVFQYAILRDQISRSIAPIFHRHEVKIYHYEYLGAWRRHSAEVTPEVEQNFALRDVNGQMYMAPRSPNGVFLLVDIRKPEVRARLVEDARTAVRAGFDGIFLDGWPFWSDATGDVGGNVPSATESLAYARWLLLRETEKAIREENPKATLGILTNHYYDTLGVGDWGMKEFMYGSWYTVERASGNDLVGHYQPATGTVVRQGSGNGYEEEEAPYIPGPIAYGAKGFSPVAVQSSLHFIRHPTGLYYTDLGQFPAAALEKYLDDIVAVFKEKDLYITTLDPKNCGIRFEGKEEPIIQSTELCSVQFSRPVCLVQLPNGKPVSSTKSVALDPAARYKLLRECKDPNLQAASANNSK